MEKLVRNQRCWLLFAAMALAVGGSSCRVWAATPVEQALLAKAQSLAAHGHLDMAVQTWDQVLLSDPKNKEALAGVARADMQLGKPKDAQKYLDRLRALGVDAATVGQIEAMPHVQPPSVRLQEASRLAQSGKYIEAMRVYRDIYGDQPPAGDAALAYYDTEAAIPADRPKAIDGLRKLAQQFPADSRYAVTLGRVLTYDPKTRPEGIEILKGFSSDTAAIEALKRAETWNESAANNPQPAVAASSPRPAGNPLEAAAYRALNSGHLDEAQQRFQDLLTKEPNNASALSGMGYVLMKEKDFAGAENYLERARAAGATNLESSIGLSQFWQRMGKGNDELKANNSDAAIEDFRAASSLKPTNPDALEALAGALMQKGSAADAEEYLQRVLRVAPARASAWRGLFLAQSSAGDAQTALATNDRMPRDVKAQLETDPDYIRSLAQDDLALGRKADFDRLVDKALALPFPNQGRDMPADKQMQYASLLMAVRRYEPALMLFRQVSAADPENAGAWRALIAAEHQLHRDDEALAAIGRIPQDVFSRFENDASFLALVGSIYQSQRQWDRAGDYLERALSATKGSNAAIEMQLADVYAAEARYQDAFTIYNRQTQDHPENLAAWRGLAGVLHQSGRDHDAIRVVASMPESTRLRIEFDPGYLQTLASIQAATGRNQDALKTFERLGRIYADQQIAEPVDVEIQYGWALLKAGDDRKLYALVTAVAGTPEISDEQQDTFNQLLAAWSVRRATAMSATGDHVHAVAILEAAARAIPGNKDVLSALAGAYLTAGLPKRAVAIYESIGLTDSNVGTYQGAIGAALAAGDMKHAAAWIQSALDRFQGDAAILKMAAQYEQATGNSKRAIAYYQAALAAMGRESAAEMFQGAAADGKLSGSLINGNSPTQDLMNLLAPKGRGALSSDANTPAGNRNDHPMSWLEPPAKSVPTLGDFAHSGQDLSADPVPPAQTGQYREDTPPHPVPIAQYPAQPSEQFRIPAPDTRAIPLDHADCCQERLAETAEVPKTFDPPPYEIQSQPSREIASNDSADLNAVLPQPQIPLRKKAQRDAIDAQNQLPPQISAGMDENTTLILKNAVQYSGPQEASPAASQGQISEPLPGIQVNQGSRIQDALPTSNQNVLAPQQLPPLTGPDTPTPAKTSPRDQIYEQLAAIQGASSPWLGGSSGILYRSGQPGYDQLSTYSVEAEQSGMLGAGARLTLITEPVLLDAGTATGASTLQQGTLSSTAIPTTESASGIGGELQLRASKFAAAVGTTPRGFLISNITGAVTVHPPASHFTVTLARSPIVDTQLSYAGLRDQGSISATYPGSIWGGAIANSGELQVSSGDSHSGWYLQGGGQNITGVHIPSNSRFDGDVGAYWAVWHHPDFGNLSVGMNFFGMHYAQNLRYFTYGQAGYFSPDAYFVAAVPFTFNGHYRRKLQFHVTGSLGFQAFNEASSPFYPLDPAIQTANGNLSYPAATHVGGNYNLESEVAHAIAERWYVGGYMNFNNTRDYASSNVGFFVRYLFRAQPLNEDSGPTGLFPVHGFRPLQVP